jgi:RsiW-degrading membrane proteinase PrsW (M82 family)
MRSWVRARRWLLVAGGLVLVLLELAFLLAVAGANDFVVGVVFSAVPIPLWIGIALWVDRYEPEPPWLLLTAFLWGATVAVVFASIANSIGFEIVEAEQGEKTAELYRGSVIAPIVEESIKGAFLFLIFFVRRNAITGILDGIVYATMVGAGFAIIEDISYYARSAEEGNPVATFAMFAYRGVLLGLSHPVFTALTGIGLGILAARRDRPVFWLAPALGLLAAIGLHAFNNTEFAGGWTGWLLGTVVVSTAILLMLVIAALVARREAALVREHLSPDVVSPDEVQRLYSLRGRIADFVAALRKGGLRGVRARDVYIRTITELAWERHRAARTPAQAEEPVSEVEAEYRARLQQVSTSTGRRTPPA